MMSFPYKNLKVHMYIVVSALFVFTILGSSCYLSDTFFMDNATFPKWLMFCIGTALILILFALHDFRKKVYFSYSDLLVGVVLISFLILLLFKASQFQDAINWSIFVCFCIACRLSYRYIDIIKLSSLSYIGSASISTIIAIKQFFENEDLTGCYDNLVGLNITLILGILSVLYLLKSCVLRKSYRIIFCLLIMLFAIILLMTKSRLVVMALTMGCIVFFPKKKIYIIVPVLSILCIISYIDSKKLESTYGRGFILQTTMTLLDSPDKLLTGYGENGFKLNYMPRQFERLKIESEATKQRASNIIHPLNEFLLMSVKYGIVFSTLILFLLSLTIINKKVSPLSKAIISVIITYTLFSYPLKYPISWIAIGVAIISNAETTRYKGRLKFAINYSAVLLSIGIVLIVTASNTVWMHRVWKDAHTHAVLGQKQQALSNYNKISKRLNTDEFIFNYSSYLHNLNNNEEAKYFLSNIDMVNYETKMLSGTINVSMQLYEDALQDFNIAHGMCPNRFLPLFEIYKIYEKTNNKDGQKKYSELIRNKKIKIPSYQIENMIDYVTIRDEKAKVQ